MHYVHAENKVLTMRRYMRRIIRYLHTRKNYLCFLIIWFGFTYLLLADYKTRDSNADRGLTREKRIVSDTSSNSCNCTSGSNPKPTQLRIPVVAEPGRPAGVKYTHTGLISRAKTDPLFLQRLLDQNFLHKDSKKVIRCFLTDTRYDGFDQDLNEPVKFQTNYNVLSDTIVFLHIQKTGGSHFNERVKSLKLPFSCSCNVVPCLSCRPGNGTVWIYTWAITGWKCGLHADWTQMHRCMPELIDRLEGKHRNRRYFYITQLRSPIDRYLSEWKHQYRGSHWQDVTLGCGRGVADWRDVRPCFIGESWKGVSLDDFMACPHNLATNRQARMLADLNLTDCYRHFADYQMKVKRGYSWIKSAMYNLKQMEYFGIMEEQDMSDNMFKETFGLQLKKHVIIPPGLTSVTEVQFKKIIKLVELDIHVYMFAKELFYRRAKLFEQNI